MLSGDISASGLLIVVNNRAANAARGLDAARGPDTTRGPETTRGTPVSSPATKTELTTQDVPGSATAKAKSAELSADEQDLIKRLRARDAEVRRHEQAHAAVGGQYAGSPSYTYQTGPDGRRYAIGGEVPIDVAPVRGDPEATIRKMEIVKAAALAPAEPSGADRRIAALADSQRMQAMADLNRVRAAEARGDSDEAPALTSLLPAISNTEPDVPSRDVRV